MKSKLCSGSRESIHRSRASIGFNKARDEYTIFCSVCLRELRPLKHPGSNHFVIVPAHKPEIRKESA